MPVLKKLTKVFRKFQKRRRRLRAEKMANFKSVILTISDIINSFIVSVVVNEHHILIRPRPRGMHEGKLHFWPAYLELDDITPREEMNNSVIVYLKPPFPDYYELRFPSSDLRERFLKLIRA